MAYILISPINRTYIVVRLHEKLQGFMEQYDLREKHFNSVVKAKDLELQLAQAKLDRQNRASQEGAVKLDLLKSQLQESTKTEAELRKQLSVYVEKFKQVEETLNKSNTLFQTFRKEMEAMAKKGGRLEKVNVAIRAKCDTMNRNILEMVEEVNNRNFNITHIYPSSIDQPSNYKQC